MWKYMSLMLLAAALSAGATLAQDATPVPSQPNPAPAVPTPEVVGGNDAALRAFIARYLGSSGAFSVMIGALPIDLPFPVSTPADAIVYSTIIRYGEAGAANSYDIMYDTDETAQGVLDFYKKLYGTSDWTVMNESLTAPSGFNSDSNGYMSFCYQQGAATLNVNTSDAVSTPNAVSLNIQVPGDPYLCAPTQAPASDPMYTLIPSLALPQGVTVAANMGGGFSYYRPNGRSNSVSAILDSARPLAEIANDYNAQLTVKGWTPVSSENSARAALSTWTLNDDTGKMWSGTLLIVADKDANRYNAVIYIEE